MPALRRLVDFLGLRRSLVGLLSMVILVGLGEKMAERFLPLYLLALGGSVISVGLLNGLDNLLSALYSLPGGYLSDRLGTKRALLIFNLLAMAGFLVVVLIPVWQAVIVGSFFFLSWTAISLPASMGLVAKALPSHKRTMGVALHSLVRRAPMALGPLIGGLFIDVWGERLGVRLAFVAALAMALIAIILQQTLIEDDRPNSPLKKGTGSAPDPRAGSADDVPRGACTLFQRTAQPAADRLSSPPGERNAVAAGRFALLQQMSPALRNLLASDILIRFCEQIPYAFVVIWCYQAIRDPVSGFEFGILTAVEMATAALLYIPVAYLADRAGKKPFVLATFVFFTLFPLVLLFCQSFWPLVGVFVLRGLKEFGDSTRKALILDLAPPGREALTFGAYYLARDSIVSLAAFGGAFLWQISPKANFLTAFAFGVLGTIWFAFRGKDLGPPPAAAHEH